MISQEIITQAYAALLDRKPESQAIIKEKQNLENVEDLILEIITSDEFVKSNHDYIADYVL